MSTDAETPCTDCTKATQQQLLAAAGVGVAAGALLFFLWTRYGH